METYHSSLLVIMICALYLLTCHLMSDVCADWLRAQLTRLFGPRKPEEEDADPKATRKLYPLRWYEQLLWPVWMPIVLVMWTIRYP